MYEKLRDYIRQFFENEEEKKALPEYWNLKQVHTKMRLLFREVVRTKHPKMQLLYLSKVYKWFTQKLDGMNGRSKEEKENEKVMFNPEAVQAAKEEAERVRVMKLGMLKDTNL